MKTQLLPAAAKPWHIVYTCPNSEKKVRDRLLNIGIDCYLPMQKVMRTWSDRKKIVEVPFFPQYVFVQVDKYNFYSALDMPGTVRFVTFNKVPAVIQADEMKNLQNLCQLPGATVEYDIQMGDRVRIEEGPFCGLEGIVFQKKGNYRLGIRLDSINQSVSVEINPSYLKKIECIHALA